MNYFNFKELCLRGDIAHRLLMNYSRMESKYYTPDYIFTADVNGWPGDWEGRTMLALILLGEATGKEPSYLEEIMDQLDDRLNEKGFFGEIYPKGVFNEQQLSGHNWFLRALLEYYRVHHCEKTRKRIQKLINNLYLPVKGYYKDYPLDPEVRGRTGEYAGNITGQNGHWYTSSDIGCAYMCLDGLSMAYEIFCETSIKELLDEMIDNFIKIDFIGSSMQTHASLSAVRGILRLYVVTNEERYLKLAKDIFVLYEKFGMTENYANQNWFNRPNTWTEPCAIVDSYICAVWLYDLTKEIHYLELSHKIYYNAIGFAQRPTGGFGCDVCAGFDTDFIRPHAKGLCEAVWCCTMRGAEGLAEYAKHLFAYEQDRVYLLNYNSASLSTDTLKLKVKTRYPYEGNISIVAENSGGNLMLCLFVPSYLQEQEYYVTLDGETYFPERKNGFIFVELTSGIHTVALSFEIPLLEEPAFMQRSTPGRYHYYHGFLMLGCESHYVLKIPDKNALTALGNAKYQLTDSLQLRPINDVLYCEEDDITQSPRQILFPKV